MVYSTRRFVVCLSVCHFVLVFFSPFSIAITSLLKKRANLSAFRTFVRFVLVWICRFPSSSWGLGRAAVCDCGTPCTFLVGELLDELQWPTLQERRQQASLTLFYKIHNNLAIIDKSRYLSVAG